MEEKVNTGGEINFIYGKGTTPKLEKEKAEEIYQTYMRIEEEEELKRKIHKRKIKRGIIFLILLIMDFLLLWLILKSF